MVEFLKILAGHLNSSVFILIVILVFMFILMYKAGKWHEKFCTHDNKIKDLDDLTKNVISLQTKIDLIYQNTNPNALVRSRSPLSLSEKGFEVADKIKAHDIFNKYKKQLFDAVEKSSPENAYDIQ